MRIAVVRAPGDALDIFLEGLAVAGLRAWTFADPLAFQRILGRETFDLAALGWSEPPVALLDLIARLRASPMAKAAIVLVAPPPLAAAAAQGLYAGADDILPPDLEPDALRGRLAAARRRANPQAGEGETLRVGPFEVDRLGRTVTRRGRVTPLTRKEYALFEALLAAAGRPLSRSYLLEAVWGRADEDSRTLDAHIYRLRNKLQLRTETALRLTPVYGYGYQLDLG